MRVGLIVLPFLMISFSIYTQTEISPPIELEEESKNMYIGVTTNYLTMGSWRVFGYWGNRRVRPYTRFSRVTTRSSFSISPHFGFISSENTELGVVLDHRSQSRRGFVKDVDTGLEFEEYSTTDLLGFGFYSRHYVLSEYGVRFFIRPSLLHYTENYREYRDAIPTTRIKDDFIRLDLGFGFTYDFSDQLRVVAQMSWFNYSNGRWRDRNTGLGEKYSSLEMNLSLRNIFLGIDWRF